MTALVTLALAVAAATVGPAPEPPTDAAVLRAVRNARGWLDPRLPWDDIVIVKNNRGTTARRLAWFGGGLTVRATTWECVTDYRTTTAGVLPLPVPVVRQRVAVVNLVRAVLVP